MDLATLVIANGMLLACSAVVLYWMEYSNPRLKGIGWMARAGAAAAAGMPLLLAPLPGPVWVYALLGNGLVLAAIVLINHGLKRLLNHPVTTWPLEALTLTGAAAGLLWFSLRHDYIEFRMVTMCLAMGVEVAVGFGIAATAPPVRGIPHRPMLAVLGAFSGFNLARATGTWLVHGHRDLQLRLQTGAAAGQLLFCAVLSLGSVWLATSELHEQLEGQVRVDELTGLLNLRALRQALAREVEAARRTGAPLSVLVLDLDHFKRINDNCGHPAGDAALRTLAGILSEGVRARDVVSRAGGEEFVIVLPGQDIASAFATAERLRRTIEAYRFVFDGVPVLLTASLGVAAWLEGEESSAELLKRADAALYGAKRAGRNRTVAASDVSDSTRLISSPQAH